MVTGSNQISGEEFLGWLRSSFRELNEQFFVGQLIQYEIHIQNLNEKTIIRLPNGQYRPPLPKGLEGLCLADYRLIFIHSKCEQQDREQVREVLLHEMCHAAVFQALPPGGQKDIEPHGKEFIAELRRIAALGEEWADRQARDYGNTSHTRRAISC